VSTLSAQAAQQVRTKAECVFSISECRRNDALT
jgi:hypothetical protein